MKTLAHLTNRSLALLGQGVFAWVAAEGSFVGKPVGEAHHAMSSRPVSLGHDDRMHPGKGGA